MVDKRLKNSFKFDWDELNYNPLTLGGLFLGIGLCYLLELVCYYIFLYIPIFWIAAIIFIAFISLIIAIHIKISKTSKGSWIIGIVMLIAGFVLGWDVYRFQYFQSMPSLNNITTVEAYNTNEFASVKFKDHKLLKDKFIYKSYYYAATKRNGGRPAKYWVNVYVPLVDQNWKEGDKVKFVLFREGESSSNPVNIKWHKSYLTNFKNNFLEMETDDSFKEELMEIKDRNFKLDDYYKILTPIEKEEELLNGKVEDLHHWGLYLMITILSLIFGIPTWIHTCKENGGPWFWVRD